MFIAIRVTRLTLTVRVSKPFLLSPSLTVWAFCMNTSRGAEYFFSTISTLFTPHRTIPGLSHALRADFNSFSVSLGLPLTMTTGKQGVAVFMFIAIRVTRLILTVLVIFSFIFVPSFLNSVCVWVSCFFARKSAHSEKCAFFRAKNALRQVSKKCAVSLAFSLSILSQCNHGKKGIPPYAKKGGIVALNIPSSRRTAECVTRRHENTRGTVHRFARYDAPPHALTRYVPTAATVGAAVVRRRATDRVFPGGWLTRAPRHQYAPFPKTALSNLRLDSIISVSDCQTNGKGCKK